MTTDKTDAAAAHRILRDYYNSIGWTSDGEFHEERAAELDPPKPTYPDGTIAWVSYSTSNYRTLCECRDGAWIFAGCGSSLDGLVVTKVEPLRVLGDDEIAVKRPSNLLAGAARKLREAGYGSSAAFIESGIAAMAAEQVHP